MKSRLARATRFGSILLGVLALTACGGSKLVKNAAPVKFSQPLAAASDARIEATLDYVLVRNGVGAWAKNADWDEYLLRVRSTGQSVTITQVTVVDSLGHGSTPLGDRKLLVKASRQAARRFSGSGLKVKAGMGGATLAATGLGAGLGTGFAVVGIGGSTYATAGVATLGMVTIIPGFAIAGIVRAVNNGKVNKEIVRRHTGLPVATTAGEDRSLDLFFPLSPSPQRVEISYVDSAGAQQQLVMDTRAALDGLHLRERAATGR